MSSPELIEEFVSESRRSLQQLEADLLHAERNGADDDLIGRVFRTVHSMKGNGGFLGFTTLVELSHEAETVMDAVRNGELELNHALMDAILGAIDRLTTMLDDPDLGEGQSIEAEVAALTLAAGGGDSGTDSFPADDMASSESAVESNPGTVFLIKADAGALRKSADVRKEGMVKGLEQAGELIEGYGDLDTLEDAQGVVEFKMRSELPGDIIADLYNIPAGDVQEQLEPQEQPAAKPASQSTPQDPVQTAKEQPQSGALVANQAAPASSSAPSAAAEAKGATTPKPSMRQTPQEKPPMPTETGRSANPSSGDTSVRVSTRFLDDLLEFTGNMVMARNQLLSRYQFHDDISFATLSRCITNVHKSVVQQRMQSIGTLFDRFHRVVRDLSRKLGKEVDLFIEGGEIELDRTILEAFSDPLTHMVRNALDHAIETPDERTAGGKGRGWPFGSACLPSKR